MVFKKSQFLDGVQREYGLTAAIRFKNKEVLYLIL